MINEGEPKINTEKGKLEELKEKAEELTREARIDLRPKSPKYIEAYSETLKKKCFAIEDLSEIVPNFKEDTIKKAYIKEFLPLLEEDEGILRTHTLKLLSAIEGSLEEDKPKIEYIEKILPMLRDEDEYVRWRVLEGLEKITPTLTEDGNREVIVDKLMSLLEKKDWIVKDSKKAERLDYISELHESITPTTKEAIKDFKDKDLQKKHANRLKKVLKGE